MAEAVPTFFYRLSDAAPELFHVAPGSNPPAGYADSPAKCGERAPDPAPRRRKAKA